MASLNFDFLARRNTVSPETKKIARDVNFMAASMKVASVVSAVASVAMVAGMASLVAQAVALGDALAPLVGLIGLIPALGIGAAAGIGALVIGFSGIGAALKKSSGAAASAGPAIAAAERRIEMAQRAATSAQDALNQARETAADALRDIITQMARANLDQKEAALSVRDAEIALRQARMSGDHNQTAHAELELESARLSQVEITNRASDTEQEYTKRQAQGVEKSDEVQSALQNQADATYELAAAQTALKQAQSSGGGGVDAAAAAYAKLAPAARQVVDVLREIGPAWRKVVTATQQALFVGAADSIRRMSQSYLPLMGKWLPQLATGWNDMFKAVSKVTTSAQFVKEMDTSLGNAAAVGRRLGAVFAPFVAAFGHWAAAGSAFLPGIADWVARIGKGFEAWSARAPKTEWIQVALDTLSLTWQVVKNLGAVVVGVFRAGSGGPNWLPGLVAGTAALSAWVNSPVGQGKLAGIFSLLRDVGSKLFKVLEDAAPALLGILQPGAAVSDTFSVFQAVVGVLADNLDHLSWILPILATGFVLAKAAETGSYVVSIVRLPLTIAQIIAQWRLASALQASTAAMLESTGGTAANTAATEVSTVVETASTGATKKGIVALAGQKLALIGSRLAMIAGSIATAGATAATWLLNVALTVLASPILLVVVLIAGVVAILLVLYHNVTWFREGWDAAWAAVVGTAKAAGAFIMNQVVGPLVWALTHPTAAIAKAWSAVWSGISAGFKGFVNYALIDPLNAAIHLLNNAIDLLNHIPYVNIGHISPIPHWMAKGGMVPATAGGVPIIAGEGGEDEFVIPRSKMPSVMGAGGGGDVHIYLHGPPEIKRLIRKIVHDDGHGNVQTTFGS